MYLHSTRGRFPPENTDFFCPLFPSVRIRVDCTRAAVHPSSFVFCRAGVLSPLRLRSLPHLSCIFICFPFISTALVLCAPARPFPSSLCAPQRPDCLRSHGLRQRCEPACARIAHYTSIPLRCRCHVTRTAGHEHLPHPVGLLRTPTHPSHTSSFTPVADS